jgi:hypothetical protein
MGWLGRLGGIGIIACTFAACGGSSDGGGGAGQGGTGATGGGGGGSSIPLAEIEQICAKVDQLPCKVDYCVADATESAAEALKQGCASEFKAILDCTVAHPMVCVDGQPELDPACAAANQAYEDCGSGDCVVGSAVGSECQASCIGSQQYDVSCAPTASPDPSLSCTCTSGPKTGGSFTVVGGCSDTEWMQAAAVHCDAG